MSNYPDGVTGNEYEIAGPDKEWEEEFECENDEFQFVMIHPDTFEYISKLGRDLIRIKDSDNWQSLLYQYASRISTSVNMSDITSEIQTEKCGFVGYVDKQSYRGQIWWQCPRCGKEYEDEIEPPEPYDDYYGY